MTRLYVADIRHPESSGTVVVDDLGVDEAALHRGVVPVGAAVEEAVPRYAVLGKQGARLDVWIVIREANLQADNQKHAGNTVKSDDGDKQTRRTRRTGLPFTSVNWRTWSAQHHRL